MTKQEELTNEDMIAVISCLDNADVPTEGRQIYPEPDEETKEALREIKCQHI